MDEVVSRATEISGKIGENLRASLAHLPLSKQLVTLKLDADLPYTFEQLHKTAPDQEKLRELFTTLEFKSWLKELLDKAQPATLTPLDYQTILTKTEFLDWLKQLAAAPCFAFDTETTSLNTLDAQIVGVSFAIKPHQAIYIPVAHDYLDAPEQLPRDYVLQNTSANLY